MSKTFVPKILKPPVDKGGASGRKFKWNGMKVETKILTKRQNDRKIYENQFFSKNDKMECVEPPHLLEGVYDLLASRGGPRFRSF